MKNILAIDPGASGGFAWYLDGATSTNKMPDTEGDVIDYLRSAKAHGIQEAIIEEVGGFAGKAQPGSAMFKFGRGVGFLHGALLAFGFRVTTVRPQLWQKHFSLGTAKSCASKTEWKNKLKSEAQRRFPQCSVTLSTADALLILDYANSQTAHLTGNKI